jgi:hypothetical protein
MTWGLDVRVELTPREQALTSRLRAATEDPSLHEAARAAAGRALDAWHEGHRWERTLFSQPIDADARLAFVRWGLLHDLDKLAADSAPSMLELLALGDRSPDGWLVAVDVALRSVGRSPAQTPPRQRAGEAPYLRDEQAAIATLAPPGELTAPRLTVVDNPQADVRLTLGMGGEAPLTLVQWWRPGQYVPATRHADPARWRVLNALAGSIYAVERMRLDPEPEQAARAVLAAHLAACLTGRDPDDTMASVLDGLARLRPLTRQRPPGAVALPPLGAMALALQRLAGVDGGPLRRPVPGAWVQVLDRDRKRVVAVARIVEQPADAPAPRGGRHARRSREPWVRVAVDGGTRDVPLDRLRLYRIPLLP